jgi:hypothetical protein
MNDEIERRAELALEILESENIANHIESKSLHNILECTLDPMETEEFGAGACLYHGHVCIIAHKEYEGTLSFDVLHPADDKALCPEGLPIGFIVVWDFDALETSRLVRRLAAAANKIYRDLGIGQDEPDCDIEELARRISEDKARVS